MRSCAESHFFAVSEQGAASLPALRGASCPLTLLGRICAAVAVVVLCGFAGVGGAPPRDEVVEPKPALILKGHGGPICEVAYSLDGKSLFTAGGHSIRLWDLGTGKPVREVVRSDQLVHQLALSSDGKRIAYTENTGEEIRLIDAGTGNEIRRFNTRLARTSFWRVVFSPCGALLAAASANPYKVHVWEVASGKERHVLRGHGEGLSPLAFSPDARLLATAGDDGTARLWDVRTGKELRRLLHPADSYRVRRLAFSPDGKVLATVAWGGDPVLCLWEVETGKKLKRLGALYSEEKERFGSAEEALKRLGEKYDKDLKLLRERLTINAIVFSPDSKWLASTGADSCIRLWELATGKEGASWMAPRVPYWLIAFSPAGNTLTTDWTGGSATVVWDRATICRGHRGAGHPLRAEELEARWGDLSSRDAARACRATWVLVSAPGQALEKAEKFLRASPPADPARVRQAIADLDAGRFLAREKAYRELELLGERVKPALVAALAGQPGAEARKRMEELLDKINDPLHPERLQNIRLAEVLEHIGNRQARHVLNAIAGGNLGKSAAKEAMAALRRLSKRPPVD